MNIIKQVIETEYYQEKSIPYGYINKTVCGCGMTTVAIENNRNTIIAVPNVSLIENKVAQYANPNDRIKARTNVKLFGVYEGVGVNDIKREIKNLDRRVNKQPIKIMVTYDSFSKVAFVLDEFDCDLVIDESDMILGYARLKSSSKKQGVEDCITHMLKVAEKHKDKVSFISATPTPVERLPEWIQQLDRYEIEFTNSIEVRALELNVENPISALRQHIIKPILRYNEAEISGKKFSKAIIFMNTIAGAIDVIETSSVIDEHGNVLKINPRDVQFICGDSAENDMKIKEYGRVVNPTNLPKFTFVTGTGVRGIDLDDTEAMSIVVANSSRVHLMLNMYSDLKQAASRQRNKQNKNFGYYVFILNQKKTATSVNDAKEKFNDEIARVERLIGDYYYNAQGGRVDSMELIKNDASFNMYTYFNGDVINMNTNLISADLYQLEVLLEQYKKGFKVSSALSNSTKATCNIAVGCEEISYEACFAVARDLLKVGKPIAFSNVMSLSVHADTLIECYSRFGKIWAHSTTAKRMLNTKTEFETVKVELEHGIYNKESGEMERVTIGQPMVVGFVKQLLQQIYDKHGMTRKAKATDLTEFYGQNNVKFKSIRSSTGEFLRAVTISKGE